MTNRNRNRRPAAVTADRPVTYYHAYYRPYPGARVTAGDFDTRREAERAIAGCRDPHVEEVTR